MARILIVDDSVMMPQNSFRHPERRRPYHRRRSRQRRAGRHVLHQPSTRLVTLDITMPGMNGIEAIRAIREFDENANIVVVSALGQKHVVFDALRQGASNYVLKPIVEDKLIAVVNMVLTQSSGSETPA